MRDALATSIDDLDGTFSFRVSTRDEIAYAKDRLAVKPAIMYEIDDLVAVASEEVSLNRLFPGAGPEHQGASAGHLCHMVTIRSSEHLGSRGEGAHTQVRRRRHWSYRIGAGPGRRASHPVVDST